MQMLDDIQGRSPNWREANLHDLRIRYAALLADISWHRMGVTAGLPNANVTLWNILDKEML